MMTWWWLNEWMLKEEEKSDNIAVNHVQYREKSGGKGWTCHQYQSRPVFRRNSISNGFTGDQEMLWVCLCLVVWESNMQCSYFPRQCWLIQRLQGLSYGLKIGFLSQVKANGKVIWRKKKIDRKEMQQQAMYVCGKQTFQGW